MLLSFQIPAASNDERIKLPPISHNANRKREARRKWWLHQIVRACLPQATEERNRFDSVNSGKQGTSKIKFKRSSNPKLCCSLAEDVSFNSRNHYLRCYRV